MIFLVILLHALFATIFPLGKEIVNITNPIAEPIFFIAIRMLLGGGILLIYHKIKYKTLKIDWNLFFWNIIILAIFNIFLTNVPEFWSLKYLVSAKAAFLYSLCPFLSALFSYFFFSEKITIKKFLGMLIGSVGFIIMLSHESPAEQEIGGILFFSWPEIAMIVAASATVYGWIILRRTVRTYKISTLEANGVSMIIGGIMALGVSPLFEVWKPIPIYNFHQFIIYLIITTLISNIICYNLYGYLLKQYTATFISFVGFTEPLFAAFYGWIFLSETVSIRFFISSAIVLLGLYIFYIEELKQGYITKPIKKNK